MIYLKDFNQIIKCCEYDVNDGSIENIDYVRDKKTAGFFSLKLGSGIALYPSDQKLAFTADRKTWNLLDKHVETIYFHDYSNKTTTFRIQGPVGEWSTTYKALWADRDDFEVNEMAVSFEEENSEEDFLGYINMLIENKDSVSTLLALWSKNLRTDTP